MLVFLSFVVCVCLFLNTYFSVLTYIIDGVFLLASSYVYCCHCDTYDQNSPELLLDQWQKAFSSILDTVAPIRTFPMRRHRSPYLNGEIRELIRHRDFLAKQFKKNPGSSSLKQDLRAQKRLKAGSVEKRKSRRRRR